EQVLQWLNAERPDALLCANDMTALSILKRLSEVGISVPQQIAVVGYDDGPMAGSTSPPLTSVHQDFRAMGQSAGRLLVERIRAPHRLPRHICLPVQLTVRESCGAR